ncbi:MAG TPA: AAA family ATPase [Candidatus Acidoferrales bacterium]|jgi:hypothetical protein|nr:AAA family ATPase [Candidatus Acidoferrales bacterium]
MTTTQAKMAVEQLLKSEQRTDPAPVPDPKSDWLGHLDKAVRTSDGLGSVSVPRREPIIGGWFKQGDLGFIYGPRGLGKTWMGMFLARKIAEGAGLGALAEWNILASRRVLYVDGEMPMDEIRERDAALSNVPASGLYYLQHEALFHLTGKVLDLTDPAAQAAVLEKCRRDRIEVVFLDNQSCLFPGLSENAADAWVKVLPWLLELRRNRIAVIIIAHAGRNGAMRGTSRREDAAFWLINLSEPKDAIELQAGARFVARFEKTRNTVDAECPSLEWTFQKPPGGTKLDVTWKKLSTYDLFRQCIEEGRRVASDIAEHLGLTSARVSQLAAKAIKEGWLVKDGRNYMLKSDEPMARWKAKMNPEAEAAKAAIMEMLKA